MKKQDIIGIVGGSLLILFSYLDKDWQYFWFIAGIVIILWSLVSIVAAQMNDHS